MYLKAQWIQAAGALALLLAAPAAIAAEVTVDLVTKRERLAVSPGRYDTVITLNNSLPGPILRFREGDTVTVNLKNQLPEMTAIHWHGLLIPGHHDGAPGFNGFNGVQAGETYQYKFTLRQSGTYWYHSHASTQEQAGQYGALIIDPKDGPDVAVDREHVILLTDHTPENPERIARNLKADPGYYNWNKRTFTELLRDASKFGLGKTLADRAEWGRMRMDVTDIADVGNYTLLANGLPTVRKPFFEVKKGEKVRLRFINGSAMSFMDVRIPGLTMTVIAADGRMVEPVKVDEFRMGVYAVLRSAKEGSTQPSAITDPTAICGTFDGVPYTCKDTGSKVWIADFWWRVRYGNMFTEGEVYQIGGTTFGGVPFPSRNQKKDASINAGVARFAWLTPKWDAGPSPASWMDRRTIGLVPRRPSAMTSRSGSAFRSRAS